MIVVADGWKRCSQCRLFKPTSRFTVRARRPDGTPRLWQSYCVKCGRERKRELKGHKPRRAIRLTPKQRSERYYAKLYADPERHAERLAGLRIYNRGRRDRARGGPPKPYPLRKMSGGPVIEPYRPPSRFEVVPAEPLVRYLRRTFPGWNPGEITSAHGGVIARRLLEAMNGKQEDLELDAVDRFLTIGLGRPDLLNALYPVEDR